MHRDDSRLVPGIKHDSGKSRVDLIEPQFILGVGDVMHYGAKKYTAHNWKNNLAVERLYAAAQRHLLAFWSGEIHDAESGLSHLYHASTNLMMLDFYVRNSNPAE